MSVELCDLPAHVLTARIDAGEITSLDALESCLARIEAVEPRVKAFLTDHAGGGPGTRRHRPERRASAASPSP